MKRHWLVLGVLLVTSETSLAGVRIKDITSTYGLRDYQLVGYGLVVGLQGTGDTLRNTPFTEQSLSSMLSRMGVNLNVGPNAAGGPPQTNLMRTRNLASVMVTASMPPFAAWGTTLDITVSSLGDATSLMGGTLILTPLTGVDGAVYAIAQGPLAVSGFAVSGQNETLTHGVATVGRIANGATIEKEPPRPSSGDGTLALELHNPDFATSVQITDAINKFTRRRYHSAAAVERDNRTVALHLPPGVHATRFLAEIGDIHVSPSTPAKVVINERTGTVVIGADVQISPVAVTHGGLTLRVTEMPQVSQPAPFSNGQTVVTSQTSVTASEPAGQVATLTGPNLKTLVKGLNQIGLKPTDIISILQAIKNAGAMQAEIVVQ
ncbi:flagellar basal body P-ring protein FlgI [Methylocystis sp. MJC1]|jgi:flagellar P-ring protein precursor FlgI|uniref:flagellar basal body P-ring protein FlgI n=1 Tax=Methylocystis sp. MJC1 TaxID=2654282 RepID=UPI0013E9D6D3|nr:flagellar basal body P-ring protein FlgI [Methylocystis sp. MJC1]KAF2990645.1 Flagellar P-ring protein [Methylocystis sp. MJC1]MBU6525693.1 flagellar basal body P-ring protein FlgI [Methylocystis sp. MJC1]UZX12165.1 flagellar basal body P-ring protein FlgI [Methylocystis sp. MJC1]